MPDFLLLWDGLCFGMVLQLAIGPVCLMVLNISLTVGFLPALSMITAVALADAFYISLSLLGVTALLNQPTVRKKVQWIGGMVLIVFGMDALLGAFGVSLLPNIHLYGASGNSDPFIKGLVVTLSNPLTLLFWGGVLTNKVSKEGWKRKQLCFFAVGCVLATVIFLTGIAALASIMHGNIPFPVIKALNIAVGGALIGFGVRMLIRKE